MKEITNKQRTKEIKNIKNKGMNEQNKERTPKRIKGIINKRK